VFNSQQIISHYGGSSMVRLIGSGILILTSMSMAMLSEGEKQGYENAISEQNGYLTQNGNEVVVMIPVEELYQDKTTYLAEGADGITTILESLIKRSSGRVYLRGLLNEAQPNYVFATSALYAQVSNLSEYLLKSVSGVSYSPVTVEGYQKNNNYKIWERFPNSETFVSLSLVVD